MGVVVVNAGFGVDLFRCSGFFFFGFLVLLLYLFRFFLVGFLFLFLQFLKFVFGLFFFLFFLGLVHLFTQFLIGFFHFRSGGVFLCFHFFCFCFTGCFHAFHRLRQFFEAGFVAVVGTGGRFFLFNDAQVVGDAGDGSCIFALVFQNHLNVGGHFRDGFTDAFQLFRHFFLVGNGVLPCFLFQRIGFVFEVFNFRGFV